MSEQTLTITKTNGEKFVISKTENMSVLMFLPSSPFFNVPYDKIPGRHGELDIEGGSFDSRDNIKSRIFFRSKNIYNFNLFRNEIFRLFASQEPFYITTNREPGKRWKVRVASKYEIEPKGNGTYGVFEIIFKSASAFVESVGTTLSPMTFKSGLWQFGQGLSTELMQYVHRTTSFRIFNAGDVMINPKDFPLLIRFRGSSENLKITNKTTGDEWSWTGTTTGDSKTGEVIQLKDVRAFKGVNSIFSRTNFKLINIAIGWNEFELTGVTGDFYISFDFRFYYL